MRALTKTDDEVSIVKEVPLSERRFERINYYFKTIRDGAGAPPAIDDLMKEIRKRRSQEDKYDFRQARDREANSQILTSEREAWMRKHGVSAESSLKFTKFLRELFDVFDEDGSQTLEVHEIVLPLLALGIAPEAIYIESALKMLLNATEIKNIQIHRDQFVALFKTDRKCDFILEVLNSHCDDMLMEEMERQHALQLARYRNSNISNRMSVLPQIPNAVSMELRYNSMYDITRMIKGWWSSIDSEFKGLIKVGEVAEFLVEKKFVSKKHEGKRLISSFAALIEGKFVTSAHFQRIFVKSIFKGALLNIAYGLSRGDLCDDSLSLKVKITEFQRKLIVSGLKVRDGKPNKDGAQAVNAVSKYKQELIKRNDPLLDTKYSDIPVSSLLPVDMMKQYYELNSPGDITETLTTSHRRPFEHEKKAMNSTEGLNLQRATLQKRQKREAELLEMYQHMVNYV